MINKYKLHPIINSIILLTIILIGSSHLIINNEQDTVFVDNIKLFNSFNMTKDIKFIEEAKIKKQGNELDSLYAIFQSVKNKENISTKNIQQQIAYKSRAFQELQDNYTKNLSKNIWNRLNGYIKEYAQSHNIKIVLGSMPNGNVMYAGESIDFTNQIIMFSNQKYEGTN